MDVEAEIDGLYRLALADFTAARNALVVGLRKAGLAQETSRVKALAKPSAAAWAANQVYWNARGAFEKLLDAAGHLREALATGAPAQEARRAMQARNDALAAAVKRAETALVEAGHAVSPAVLRRVQASLEALAARTSSAALGRLAEDLDPPGLDVLVGLPLIETPRQPSPSSPAEDGGPPLAEADISARRREADAALAAHADSMRRLEAARAEAEEARRSAERAAARVREAEEAEAKARRAVEQVARGTQGTANARSTSFTRSK